MSACAHVGGEVAGAGVAQGDRGVLASAGSAAARAGGPTVIPRPTTTTSAPAIGTSWRRSSSTMPYGVHGSGAGLPSTSQPRLVGCRPSASLAGSIRPRTRVLVDGPGQRQLDDVAGAGGVGVELGDRRLDLGLGGGRGQVDADRLDADLGAVLVLAVDVPPRRRGRRRPARCRGPGTTPRSRSAATRVGQLGLDGLRGGGAVQSLCGHGQPHPSVSGRSGGCR